MTTHEPQHQDPLPELFDRACDLHGAELSAFLERECEGDDELRARLEALLEQDSSDQGALLDGRLASEVLGGALSVPVGGDLAVGTQVGQYTLLGMLGAGGMGTVYEARQENPRRRVAVKVLRASAGSTDLLRRFQHEAQILARLEHPGIARVYEAGTYASESTEHPFIAMELVDGIPLTRFAKERGLSTEARLKLFAEVCDAAHHAHQKMVIHRDLKPANILVDGEGRPKVLDFGVARVMDEDSALLTMQTRPGQLLGTLPYMSPEQIGGDPWAVDLRSDVYSLGVLLFELLTGELPYVLARKSLPEAARVIREDAPRRLTLFDATLRGEVVTVVERALAKEAERRYASAHDLAADVRRLLTGDPILARATTTYERVTRFVRRYRTLTIATALAMTALSIALGISIWKTGVARDATRETEQHLRTARLESCRATIAAAAASLRAGDPVTAASLLDQIPLEERGWEWHYYHAQLDRSLAVLPPEADILAEGWSDEPGVLLTLTSSGALQRRGLPDLAVTQEWPLGEGSISTASFSRDGGHLAVVRRAGPPVIELWDLRPEGRDAPTLEARSPELSEDVRSLCCDDHGRRIAFFDQAPSDWVWDRESGEILPLEVGKGPSGIAAGVDFRGAHFAAPARYGTVHLLRFEDGLVRRGRIERPNRQLSAAWSPDGSRIAIGGDDRSIGIYNTEAGAFGFGGDRRKLPNQEQSALLSERVLEGHQDAVSAMSYTPDGHSLVSASDDRTVRVWNLTTGHCREVLTGHEAGIMRLELSPDGRLCVTADREGSLRLWGFELEVSTEVLRGHERYVYDLSISPSGTRVASGAWDQTVRVWELETGQALDILELGSRVEMVSWSPDGNRIAAAGSSRSVRTFDTRHGMRPAKIGTRPLRVLDLGWLGGGERMVVVGNRREQDESGSCALLVELATGEIVGELPGSEEALRTVAVSADERWIATCRRTGELNVFDGRTLESVWRATVGASNVLALAFDPSGRLLACACADGLVQVWEPATGRLAFEAGPHPGEIWDLAWTPDGRRLATACHDGFVRLFETETGLLMAQLRGHADYVHALEFSPDGRFLVTGSGDRTVRIWDTQPFRERYQARWRAEAR